MYHGSQKAGWKAAAFFAVGAAALAGTARDAAAEELVADPLTQVFRLYNPATQNHLLTPDINEAAYLPLSGWINENSIGLAYVSGGASPVSLTIRRPLQRLYDVRNVDHVFTTDSFEAAFLLSTGLFINEGTIGYVVPNPQQGFVPLYRLVLDSPQKHLVTTDASEVYVLVTYGGWRVEGLLGYIAGDPSVPVPLAAQ
jgi:hypothetical protein